MNSKLLIVFLAVIFSTYGCIISQMHKLAEYSDCLERYPCEFEKNMDGASKETSTEKYGKSIKSSIQSFEKEEIESVDRHIAAKRDLIMLMIVNYTDTDDLERLISMLSMFPLEMIKQVVEHGVLIHILKDCPASGDIKPTDLGFGKDLNNNGIIEMKKWVDLNGDRKEEPEEREDLTPEGNPWNYINGGYDTLTNILFFKEGAVIFKCDYYDASILHEFSHAVDDALRNSNKIYGWSEEVDRNYQAACDGEPDHGFVDGFAAKNKAEYLAQSVAAYLIDKEIPEDASNDDDLLFAPDNITRAHLKKKDKAMYLFLKEKFSHPDFE